MAKKYNNVFSLLVNSRSDIAGHIAYSLYKEDKVSYVSRFKETNKREPTDDELSIFHDVSSQPESIQKYRFIASNILSSFLDYSLEESANKIEQDCYQRHADILRGVIEPLRPPKKWSLFWHGVFQSIAGAFIFALLLAAFMFIVTYKGADIPFVEKITTNTTETATAIPPSSVHAVHVTPTTGQ